MTIARPAYCKRCTESSALSLKSPVCHPQKYEPPSGDLEKQIEKDFGSLDKLVAEFNPKTVAIQVRDPTASVVS